jgi:hypothetical protein
MGRKKTPISGRGKQIGFDESLPARKATQERT